MEFIFSNPLFLWMAGAAAAPLLIHLLSRRRLERVVFSSLALFRMMDIRAAYRRRWKRILLMLLRILILLFLALALSRPMLKGLMAMRSQASLALVIDDSYSMSLRSGRETPFERASAAAERLVSDHAEGDRIQVFKTSQTSPELISSPGMHTASAVRMISAMSATPTGRSLDLAISQAVKWLDRQKTGHRELVIISDWQKRAYIEKNLVSEWEHLARASVIAVNTKSDDPDPNLSVASVSPAPPPPGSREVPVRITIANHSKGSRVAKAGVRIHGAGSVEGSVSVGPGEKAGLTLQAPVAETGWGAGEVILEPDALAADNLRMFAFRMAARPEVLLVTSSDPKNEYTDPSFYLSLALNPNPSLNLSGTLQVKTRVSDQLSSAKFFDKQAVFLVDVESMAPVDAARLRAYVEAGGGLVVFGGKHLRHEFWESKDAEWMLPTKRIHFQASSRGYRLESARAVHPVLTDMAEPGTSRIDFGSARFYERVEMTLPAGHDLNVLFSFSDKTPAFVEKILGRGRVLFFASGAGLEANTFAPHPGYVVLWHSAVRYLMGESAQVREIRPLSGVEVQVKKTASLKLEFPSGKKTPLEKSGRTTDAWIVPPLEKPGVYWLRGENDFTRPLLVNVDPGEAEADYFSGKEIRRFIRADGKKRSYVDFSEDAVGRLSELKSGIDLTPLLLVLAFLAFIAETYLSNRL